MVSIFIVYIWESLKASFGLEACARRPYQRENAKARSWFEGLSGFNNWSRAYLIPSFKITLMKTADFNCGSIALQVKQRL
jgi:hypothetical protein